jgi:hypothetical protein
MNNPLPQQSDSQRRGKAAEAAFAAFVTQQGHVWHTVGSGNDFGIDGRMELVEADGSVTGIEFGVQIKGMRAFPEMIDGELHLSTINVSTATYWVSRITITLIVLWEEQSGDFVAAWAHDLMHPDALVRAIEANRRTITLKFPLDSTSWNASWARLIATARLLHQRTKELLISKHIAEIYQTILCRAADVRDLLLEWVVWLAYDSSEALASRFATTPEGKASWVEAFADLALAPPRIVDSSAPILTTYTLCIPIHHLRGVLANALATVTTGLRIGLDNPIVASLASFHAALSMYYVTIFRAEDREKALAYGSLYDEQTMNQLGVWQERLVVVLGLIVLLIRDYERDLRRWLFPHADREPDPRVRLIADMTAQLITPTGEWHRAWKKGQL